MTWADVAKAERDRPEATAGSPSQGSGTSGAAWRHATMRWSQWADAPRQLGLAMLAVVVVLALAAGATAAVLSTRHAALRTASERTGFLIDAQRVRADLSFADANSAALVFDEITLDLGLVTGKPARDAYDRGRTQTTSVTNSLADAARTISSLHQLGHQPCPQPRRSPAPATGAGIGADASISTGTGTGTARGISAGATSRCEGTLLDALQSYLPTYVDLVATARADNRNGQQVAQAYLKRASELMRESITPVADQLVAVASDDLTRQTRRATDAAAVAVLAVLLGAGCLTMLGVQVLLFRRTNRILDLRALAGAAVLLVAVTAVFTGAGIERSRVIAAGEHGYAPTTLLTQARSLILRAHADENLSLISLNDANPYEKNFDDAVRSLGYRPNGDPLPRGSLGDGRQGALVAALARLPAADRQAVTDNVTGWLHAHARVIRVLANPDASPESTPGRQDGGKSAPNYLANAAQLTVDGEEPAFAQLDNQLAAIVDQHQKGLRARMNAVSPPLDWLGWASVLGMVVAAVLTLTGIWRRQREYAR
ncbi:hypothetical protein [Frankia tisae]|uniref:hypothetical protein n=1 Tax=Frankia tisae TaxID=2950104 RepID=UPI0021BF9F25|nr:hypothetical protein [Frankia tisae]